MSCIARTHRPQLRHVLLFTLMFGGLQAMPGRAEQPVRAAGTAPPSCLGAHDLLVDHGSPTLGGGSYDRVCILHGSSATLASGAVLRSGLLYIDASSALRSNGLEGGRPYQTDCAGFGNGTPTGSPGGQITVLAHQAVVLGQISAAGGAGANGYQTPCANYVDPGGNGGPGGSITLKVVDLQLEGSIAAPGGNGGPGKPAAGVGGAGGTVTILAQHPDRAAWLPLLSAPAGQSPAGGTPVQAGSVVIGTLSTADLALLPVAPPPLTQRVGQAPTLLPVQPTALFTTGMHCGPGDLVVPAGTTLHLQGMQSYPHICIQGTLRTGGALMLLAQTILVAASARISASAVISRTSPISPTDPCAPTHAVARAGYRGATGAATMAGPGGAGGLGGGAITLVATRLLFAGTASVDGGAGGRGVNGGYGSPSSGDILPTGGGTGGTGGGISLVAADLQLTGTLSARGGAGGQAGLPVRPPAGYRAPFALPGFGGCVRVFADVLRPAPGALSLPGTLYVGRRTPLDPVLPPTRSGVRYSTATFHTLSGPLLAFWQQHNGLAVFGEPISEPLVEGGQIVQYFERARLSLRAGKVVIAPLGVLVNAGRSFPPMAPIPDTATQRYFPGTRHTLRGRFLRYWLAHDGAVLFGPPISEPFMAATGDGSGRHYLVQYFRSARMEYHPGLAGTKFVVSLGALGREYLQQRGLL